jgi:hypothetical protein
VNWSARTASLLPRFGGTSARDETRRDSDRLEASRLLADRGWGKAVNFEPVEGDPLGLEDVEAAEESTRAYGRPQEKLELSRQVDDFDLSKLSFKRIQEMKNCVLSEHPELVRLAQPITPSPLAD